MASSKKSSRGQIALEANETVTLGAGAGNTSPSGTFLTMEAPTMTYSTLEEITIHPMISQDVDKLLDETNNQAHDWALGFFFTGIGLLPSLGTAINELYTSGIISALNFILASICLSLLATGIAKWTEARASKRRISELRSRLNNRPRTNVIQLGRSS